PRGIHAVDLTAHGQCYAGQPETPGGVGAEGDIGADVQRLDRATSLGEVARHLHREATGVSRCDELLRAGVAIGVFGGALRKGDVVGAETGTAEFDAAGSLLQRALPCGACGACRHSHLLYDGEWFTADLT